MLRHAWGDPSSGESFGQNGDRRLLADVTARAKDGIPSGRVSHSLINGSLKTEDHNEIPTDIWFDGAVWWTLPG